MSSIAGAVPARTAPASAPAAAAPGAAATGPKAERRLVLFYTAEVHGAAEPCGCTSDPLGDVSRLAALVADTRRGGTAAALVDAGGLLYPEGSISARERPSADLRAEFLSAQFQRIGLLGAALGETDLAGGAEHVGGPRLASNLAGAPSLLRPPRVERLGGIALGVMGVGDLAAESAGLAKASDPVDAARRAVTELRKAGAEIVVLLAATDKTLARRLARTSGADVIVVGKRVGAGMPRLEQVGQSFLVAPADELQRVGRLEIVLRGKVPAGSTADLQDAGGAESDSVRRAEVARALERLRVGLAEWTADQHGPPSPASPNGTGARAGAARTDAAFVLAKRRELSELESEKARLDRPWVPPASGNYLVNALVPLRRSLPRDPQVVAAMKKLDRRVAAVNLAHAAPPPPAEAGRPSYVGMSKCVSCHAGANAFWKTTVHAHAWKTLVVGGKQADYKCVGCHVTGFGEVGGTSLGFTRKLESVQCETCHGPGSLHLAGEGNEEPLAIKRDTPQTVCVGCHTEQHSDTFQFEPYLRDIVGKGHGAQRRAALGDGPTGHQLRSAALTKARLAGLELVKKM